nr:protein like COV 2 [Tanacetum cinerariifolium]
MLPSFVILVWENTLLVSLHPQLFFRENRDEELCSVYVPTNHLYIGDVFLVNSEEIIRPNLSIREGIVVISYVNVAIDTTAIGFKRRSRGCIFTLTAFAKWECSSYGRALTLHARGTRYVNVIDSKRHVEKILLTRLYEIAMAAFESRYIDKDTYSTSAKDIEVQPSFLDDQLTNLSPPRNCMPPDVLLRNRDSPRDPNLKKQLVRNQCLSNIKVSYYSPVSSGKTYSNASNNSTGKIPLEFSPFYNMKDIQAFYAKELPIPPLVILPPSLVLSQSPISDSQYFFPFEEISPKDTKTFVSPSSSVGSSSPI